MLAILRELGFVFTQPVIERGITDVLVVHDLNVPPAWRPYIHHMTTVTTGEGTRQVAVVRIARRMIVAGIDPRPERNPPFVRVNYEWTFEPTPAFDAVTRLMRLLWGHSYRVFAGVNAGVSYDVPLRPSRTHVFFELSGQTWRLRPSPPCGEWR
jgi:hypothetical protein